MVHKTPPVRVDACAWYPYSEALHKKLIRTARFDAEVDCATHRVDEYGQQLLGVPRQWCDYPWQGTALDRTVEGVPMALGECLLPPRNDEQAEVIAKAVHLLGQRRSHIIEASTGFGKTYCAINIAHRIGRKTLIVVTKDDLIRQWPQDIAKFFGVPSNDIGIVQQNKCQLDRRIVVGMVHSLAQREYAGIEDEFGLVIFDEVHHMAADTFSRVAALFKARLRLGLSATAARIDGKDFVFHGHIGAVEVQAKLLPMAPKVLVRRTGWKLPRVPRRINGEVHYIQLPHEAGKLMHIVTRMAGDQRRNDLIAALAVQAYQKHRWTVIFSELAEDRHLAILREIINQRGVPQNDMAFYTSKCTSAQLEVAKGKPLVLATYGMCAEATDVPWWDCAILATPRANIKQTLGRICREYPDKPTPVLIDLVDDDSDILQGYFKARLKTYQSSEVKGEVVYLTG